MTKITNKDSFLLYLGMLAPIQALSFEHKGMLLDSFIHYHTDGTEPAPNSPIYMAFLFFKNQFIQDQKKYLKTVERNRVNGASGGRPPKPKKPNGLNENPKNPGQAKKADTDTDTDTETGNENKKNNAIFLFSRFRDEYPGTKGGSKTTLKIFQKHKDWITCAPFLMPALENEIKHKAALTAGGKLCPDWKHMETWINGRCWEQEFPKPQANGQAKPTIEIL